ncbi:MAG: histidine kinase [Bacteroidota bacterium]|nr:histidine kinase [Bacteroidota bacterium]
MRNEILYWLSLLVFIAPGKLIAQYPHYKNYNVNQGLASNKVYNIIEDRYGFIWISTDQGVSRYDGVQFVNFTTRNGLPDNEVLGLYEDRTGRIWFNGFSSEPSYYFDGKIYNAGNDTFLKRVKQYKPPGMCMIIIVQHNNSVAFLIEEKGKKLFVGKEISDIEFKYNDALGGAVFQHILYIKNKSYAKISALGLQQWKHKDWSKAVQLPLSGYLSMHYTTAPGKYVWALKTETQQVWRIDPLSGELDSIKTDPAYRFLFNQAHSHVLAGDSMYAVYNQAFTQLLEIQSLPFLINRVFIDRKGNKWLGSSDNGIYFIRKYAPIKINLPEQKANGILGIVPVNDRLYLKTEGNGMLVTDATGKCSELFNAPDIKRIMGYLPVGSKQLVGADGGLFRLDENFKNPVKLPISAIKDIESGGNDEALIGTASGAFIYKFNKRDTLITLIAKRTTAICRAGKNEIWIGGINGIHKSVQNGNIFTASPLPLNVQLDQSRIVDIKKDRQGNMWVATAQSGLFYCEAGGRIVRFSETNSNSLKLLSDACLEIRIAENGNIWVANINGISVICIKYVRNKPLFSVLNYSLPEGLPDKTINSIAFWKNSVVIATPNGLFRFVEFPKPSDETGKALITQIKVNSTIYDKTALDLPYDQNNLIISYASSFINTGVTYLFRYRVKELSREWIETNTLEVPLLGLKSGNYTFEITPINSHGNAGSISSLLFNIRTPWFKQTWFFILIIILVIVIPAYYYQLMKEKITMSKNLTLFKLRILRAQMNPHFVFNALSNIQRLIHLKELNNAEDYIGTLAVVMRKSIDYSGKEFIQLLNEIDYTIKYLDIEKMRFAEKFDCEWDVKINDEDLLAIYVPPLIIQPLLENAIKHAFKGISYKGHIKITIEKLNEVMLKYTIQDNGCGFDPKKIQAKNTGMGITRERVELLYRSMGKKGYFSVNSATQNSGKGTTVTVEIPIVKD